MRSTQPLGLASHESGIELADRGSLVYELLGAGDLVIRGALELLVGHSPAQRATVDEEVGGALHAQIPRLGQILVDHGLESVIVEGGLELGHVEANLLRVFLQGWPIEGLLVGKELIMHLPELALGPGCQRCLCGQRCLVVEGERILPEEDPHFVRVLLDQSVQGGQHAAAVGALKIRVLDDGHQRLG